jgi:hypothetical protein
MADATPQEILMWALINRARLDPSGEAARSYGIDLNEGPVQEKDFNTGIVHVVTLTPDSKQPLAWNDSLGLVADNHTQDMINQGKLFHDPFSDPATHNDQVTHLANAGYNVLWDGKHDVGENVSYSLPLTAQFGLSDAMYQQEKDLFWDQKGSAFRGHRLNILQDDFQEVGVGEQSSSFQGQLSSVITEDFGRSTTGQFLTGIAYNDTDHNAFYSLGEGRGHIQVAISGGSVFTATAGNYSELVGSGAQTVTFSGGDLAKPVSVSINVTAGRNALVDLVDQSTVETSVSLTDLGGVTRIIPLANTGLTLTGNAADRDTVVFSGNMADYRVVQNADGTWTVSGGREGTDTLVSIARIEFKDGARDLIPPPVVNHAPVVTGQNATVAANAAIAMSSLFTAHDQEGDSTITQYMFMDTGSGGGHLTVNGVTMAANTWITVDAANLGSVKYVGGSTAGSEVLHVQAFDGKLWSADAAMSVTTLPRPAEDFNNDGMSDILWHNDNGSVAMWEMNGTQIALNQTFGTIGAGWHIAGVNDFNGDARSDILWQNDNGSLAMWQMNGTQITLNKIFGTVGTGWEIAATDDFNGDHKADILLFNDSTGSVALWQMNGTQITANQTVGSVSAAWHLAGTGDFNGDGKTDILWVNNNGTVAMWQMDGSRIAANQNVGTIGSGWHYAASGDFNGDGKSDVLWHNDNGSVMIWQMNGNQVTAAQTVGSAATTWHIADVGDYNRDGKSDILWHNDNGANAIWELNGSHIIANQGISPTSSDWHMS